ncbi:MAG: helix-turn-helix domain-containing protein [Candidatus Hodarchaeota archaeon]
MTESDYEYYVGNIKSVEFSLLSRALPIIHASYYRFLIDSERHGKHTKTKQIKIMRFVYHFTHYLMPLAYRIDAKDFLRDKIESFFSKYLRDVLFDLSNLFKYEIDSLLELIDRGESLGVSEYSWVKRLLEEDVIRRQFEDDTRNDLEKGESEQVEFKSRIPNLTLLAKEIAALASTNGGRIYLGVKDNREIVGIDKNDLVSFDKFQQDIANITTNTIKPSIRVDIAQYLGENKTVIQLKVPKGSEPVYYVKNVPYVRILTTSRPATPTEVKKLHSRYFKT